MVGSSGLSHSLSLFLSLSHTTHTHTPTHWLYMHTYRAAIRLAFSPPSVVCPENTWLSGFLTSAVFRTGPDSVVALSETLHWHPPASKTIRFVGCGQNISHHTKSRIHIYKRENTEQNIKCPTGVGYVYVWVCSLSLSLNTHRLTCLYAQTQTQTHTYTHTQCARSIVQA